MDSLAGLTRDDTRRGCVIVTATKCTKTQLHTMI